MKISDLGFQMSGMNPIKRFYNLTLLSDKAILSNFRNQKSQISNFIALIHNSKLIITFHFPTHEF
jgi:hypothetical protein